MSKKKVADRDYFLDAKGELTTEDKAGHTVLVRKGEEITTVMQRDHGLTGDEGEGGDNGEAEGGDADEKEHAEQLPAEGGEAEAKIDTGGSETK